MSEEMKLKGLTAYAEMMNTLDIKCVESFLSIDLRYNSQWVYEEMIGKERYLEYMLGKFEMIKESGSRPFAEICDLEEYPFGSCVVVAQENKEKLVVSLEKSTEIPPSLVG